MGGKIIFSDATNYFKNPDKLYNICNNCETTTYARNHAGNENNINIGFVLLICNTKELQFWETVRKNINKDVTDQDTVNKYCKDNDYNYKLFNRNDIFCQYINPQSEIPKFCVLKIFTDSNANHKYRRNQRLSILKDLGHSLK